MRIFSAIGLCFVALGFCCIAFAEEPLPPAPEGEDQAAGEAPESTVDVLLDSDLVLLKDGSTIEGTVILEAEKATIILTKDGEQLVPAEDIDKIERVKDKDKPVTLPVRESDGFRFIVMDPVEKDAAGDGSETTDNASQPTKDSLKKLDPEEVKKLLDKDGELDDLLKKAKDAADTKDKSKDKKRDDKNQNPETPPPPTARW